MPDVIAPAQVLSHTAYRASQYATSRRGLCLPGILGDTVPDQLLLFFPKTETQVQMPPGLTPVVQVGILVMGPDTWLSDQLLGGAEVQRGLGRAATEDPGTWTLLLPAHIVHTELRPLL